MQSLELASKRIIDIGVSFILLAFLAPLMLLIAMAIRLTTSGSIFFIHERLGKNGAIINVVKYRTMYEGLQPLTQRDSNRATIIPKNDRRVTPIGRILRQWSLDEIPQLFNVLHGEMSIVGPRPDEPLALELYSKREQIKLSMKPGITGLAMVNGRNSIPWRERLEWDVVYVEDFSILLDIVILFRTIKVVLGREGIYTIGA